MEEVAAAPGGASRKRKRPGEREKVTRACDRCKKRKIRCSGLQPCDFCTKAAARCTFDTAYARGKAPAIMPANGEMDLPHQIASSSSRRSKSLVSPGGPDESPNSQASPQSGLHGRYIGPTSGVSFLQRVQRRLGQATTFSTPDDIFTFGDPPFPPTTPDLFSCMMLPREVAQKLVNRFFDYAMPTYRYLHRPTIQAWFDELYETYGVMRDAQRASSKIALVLIVLAHGTVYMPDADKPGSPDLSHRLYAAAEQQLSNEGGPIHLTSIQARLTQCMYLLTQSQINRCWRAFGTVSHLALATGLNRRRRNHSGMRNAESESRRRTFWCAYTLDVHLSVVLGRPQLFHDEDIDIETPACVDDEDLSENKAASAISSNGPSIMHAPIAHIKLARQVKRILRELYPLRPISADKRTNLTRNISANLAEWRSNLAPLLDTEHFNASMLVLIVQRQRNVLNLTYWHAVILTHRPFLLNNFVDSRQTQAPGEESIETDAEQTEESVQQCLSSAMHTVSTIDQMSQSRQMSKAFWIAAYFAFTASVVLYIFVIQKRSSSTEVCEEYLSAASRCQAQISSIAEKGSLPERYLLLLEELRVEAMRHNPRTRGGTVTSQSVGRGLFEPGASHHHAANSIQPNDAAPTTNPLLDTSIDFGTLLQDDGSEFAEWDQFASLISSGLGNLDAFLEGDPFRQGQFGD